jgi:hypothetical protein
MREHSAGDTRNSLATTAGLSNVAAVIYFPGTLFYSAGFNVNQNFKEKKISE